MKKIIFATVVWGREFTNLFALFGLPSLLAPGNLPAMAELAPLEFRIYTDAANAAWLQRCLAVILLRDHAKITFIRISDATIAAVHDTDTAYKVMVGAHRHAVQAAWEEDAALCFNDPDRILADGSLRSVATLVKAGRRMVSGAGLSVVMETFCPALLRVLDGNGAADEVRGGRLGLGPRPLIDLALRHIHDHSAVQIATSDRFTTWPSMMYWPLAGHGFLMRSWHLVPLFIHPRRDGSGFKTSIDGDYIAQAVDWEDCAFITDSDQSLFLEPVTLRRRRNNPPGFNRLDPFDVAHWALCHANAINQRFIAQKFWLHDGEAPAEARAAAEAASDALFDDVFRRMEPASAFEAELNSGFAGCLGGDPLQIPER